MHVHCLGLLNLLEFRQPACLFCPLSCGTISHSCFSATLPDKFHHLCLLWTIWTCACRYSKLWFYWRRIFLLAVGEHPDLLQAGHPCHHFHQHPFFEVAKRAIDNVMSLAVLVSNPSSYVYWEMNGQQKGGLEQAFQSGCNSMKNTPKNPEVRFT